jgi:DNA-binding CsgD family transcriptional regulator
VQVRDATGAEPAAIGELVDLREMRVLDVGCGTGRLTAFAAERAELVCAFDPNADAVARAKAALPRGVRDRVRAGSRVDAREPLRLAVDLAHRSGATALEERALADLRATGARPRRRLTTGPDALTASERRVAELAASGRRNRQIAEELVVTLATVEYHLRNAYRKLGIASRATLQAALDVDGRAGPAKVNVRILGSRLPTASADDTSATATGSAFARTGYRSRSAPTPDSLYCRWESRSRAATSTI